MVCSLRDVGGSLFVYMHAGATFACFQSFGTISLCKEQWKIAQRIGAVINITSLVALRTKALFINLSGLAR